MIEQGRGGSIIITGSAAALKALPGQMHYTRAKHGLVGMTKAAAVELGPFGIRVNSLHPFARSASHDRPQAPPRFRADDHLTGRGDAAAPR